MKLTPEEETRAHALAVIALKEAAKEVGPMPRIPELVGLYLDEITDRATKSVKQQILRERLESEGAAPK